MTLTVHDLAFGEQYRYPGASNPGVVYTKHLGDYSGVTPAPIERVPPVPTVLLVTARSSEHRRFLPYEEHVAITVDRAAEDLPAIVRLLQARLVSAGYPGWSIHWSCAPLAPVAMM